MFLVIVAALTFAMLVAGYRAWQYWLWWQPVRARTLSSDYSSDELREDQQPFAFLRPHPWSDQQGNRRTLCRVEFADESGHVHRAEVTRFLLRGRAVPATMPIYYDRRDPSRVSFSGTPGAVFVVLLWGSALVWVIGRAIEAPALLT